MSNHLPISQQWAGSLRDPIRTLLCSCLLLLGATSAWAQAVVPRGTASEFSSLESAPTGRLLPVIADMKSLIEQGRFLDAFNLGLKNESLIGDPIYDYYFGIAAIDSGRASLGVLALERVLLTNPGNDLARLELARGYFVLQDYERAREEFELMAGKQVPPPVRVSIEKYLAAIRETDPEFRKVWRAYAEYSIGYNSNVNSQTDQGVTLAIRDPLTSDVIALLDTTLEDGESSAFTQLAVGGQLSGPLIPGLKYQLGIDWSKRQFASIDSFDQVSGTLSGGIEFSYQESRYRLFTFLNQSWFASERFRETTGLAIDWARPLNKEITLRSSYSVSDLSYNQGKDKGRDGDLTTLNAGASYFLGGPLKWMADGELTIAREKNTGSPGADDIYSRDILGLRVAFGYQLTPRTTGSLTANLSKSTFDKRDPVSASESKKKEELFSLEGAIQYQLTRGWSIRGELIRNENRSSVDLYRYTQEILLMKMRYEWK
jgi:hypothetical protein